MRLYGGHRMMPQFESGSCQRSGSTQYSRSQGFGRHQPPGWKSAQMMAPTTIAPRPANPRAERISRIDKEVDSDADHNGPMMIPGSGHR